MKKLAITEKSLSEKAEKYFNERDGNCVSIADFCSALNISIEEWQELSERKSLRLLAKRIETRIRANVENDSSRPATITSLILKQLSEEERNKVEFILRIDGKVIESGGMSEC